jgi:UDP-N-acetylglucosamine--N-acetylmuramyl-(pentapeptide) pyrophosphoryl-undecaprenol N-acetylglucosamine transferase
MASTALGIPSLIHEQNAVMGRANRLLAGRVDVIAGGFLPSGRGQHGDKIVETGNPVRPDVLKASETPYAEPVPGSAFNLLVFGGSQGAHFFSEAVPAAIERLSKEQRDRIRIIQQARPEDAAGVEAAYKRIDVPAEVSPFFNDMADRIAAAHLVISRSGASTVSELSVIGRPAILVPYPHALDHDQAANAAALEERGGAQLCRQADLEPGRLYDILNGLMRDSGKLSNMAASARAAGKPDASERLADLVVAVAEGRPVSALGENRQ